MSNASPTLVASDSAAAAVEAPFVYRIPESNLARFEAKFATLANKAAKLNFPIPTYTIGASYERSFSDIDLDGSVYTQWVTMYPVTVEGTAPCFDGWSFHSTIDYEEGTASCIFRTVRGAIEIPEKYRTLGTICEHCKTRRRRTNVYLLVHTDGTFRQVGKSCLKDFLGHSSPDQIASVAELIMELSEGMGEHESMGGVSATPDVSVYMNFVATEIRCNGWKSRSSCLDEQSCTADAAMGRFYDHAHAAKTRQQAKTARPTDSDKARAKTALEWAANVEPGNDEYLRNIKAAAQRQGVGKNAGLIASILSAWDRMIENSRAKVERSFVGEIKQRLTGLTVIVNKVLEIDMGEFGFASRHIMHITAPENLAGNIVTWKTNSKTLETGSTYTLTGTVKQHYEHAKFGKQTELLRCKVELVTFAVDEDATATVEKPKAA